MLFTANKMSELGEHVHKFYRIYATRRVISPISPCYLVRPGEDKQINLWDQTDQLDTFSKLGYM